MFRGAELEPQGIPLELHGFEFAQPLPKLLELPSAHRPLLADPILGLGRHVEFAGFRQKFDGHTGVRRFPRQGRELLFQLAQASLGRAHQVAHGRITRAHLLEHFLRRDAPFHDPDAFGLAVLRFELLEKLPQRRLVGGVAAEHFVGEWKSLRRDDQGDDHLHAIKAFVPAAAKLALVPFGKRGSLSK